MNDFTFQQMRAEFRDLRLQLDLWEDWSRPKAIVDAILTALIEHYRALPTPPAATLSTVSYKNQ